MTWPLFAARRYRAAYVYRLHATVRPAAGRYDATTRPKRTAACLPTRHAHACTLFRPRCGCCDGLMRRRDISAHDMMKLYAAGSAMLRASLRQQGHSHTPALRDFLSPVCAKPGYARTRSRNTATPRMAAGRPVKPSTTRSNTHLK